MPVRTESGGSSRDAFLYLLSFATLATWATALGSLLFELIDRWLPDTVSRGGVPQLRSSFTWQMACIAVAFPVYLAVMRLIVRETAADLDRLQSGVRKWLTWLALLITAGSLIGDLISFLDFFLTGEITARFVLKCAVVFLIAGAVFSYYIASLRPPQAEREAARKRNLAYGAGAAAVVLAVFVTGLAVAGTPPAQRKLEADRRRVTDLQTIARYVRVFWSQNQKLPGTLADPLLVQRMGGEAPADPETRFPYEFHSLSGSNFELCAGFNNSTQRDNIPQNNAPVFWNHSPGRNCFTLDAARFAPF